MSTTRVVVCDDFEILRELLRHELEEEDDVRVVGEAGDGEESVRLIRELKPDVVVLDLAMPKLDGLEAIPLMLGVDPPPKIIVHSGFDADMMAPRVLAAGAARYVEKGGELRSVRTAVRELIDEDRRA